MANKIKVKVKSNVRETNKKQLDSMKIPVEADATTMQARQGVGLKTPNLTFKVRVDPKKT